MTNQKAAIQGIKKLKIEAGKSYHLRFPESQNKVVKVHIDYILDSKAYSTDDGKPERMVVYRRWLKHKGWWHMMIDYYSTLEIYNEPYR